MATRAAPLFTAITFTGTNGTTPTDFVALNPGNGSMAIQSNKVTSPTSFGPSSTDANDSIYTGSGSGSLTADQYAEIVCTGLSNPGGENKIGVNLRWVNSTPDAPRTGYRVYLFEGGTTAIRIQSLKAGTQAQLSSVNVGAFANGDSLAGEVEQIAGVTTIRSYRRTGGVLTLIATVTDVTAPITAAGFVGVCGGIGFGPGLSGDDFFAGNLVTATVAVLSAPTPSGTLGTQTTATIGATTDQNSGTFYAVVDTTANLAGITAAEIKAGQRAGGATAVASGNSAVSTTSPSVGVTGLTAATAYGYAAIQNNTNGDSNVVTGTFTTAALVPQSSPPPTSGARIATLLLT